eukprot:XP_001709389.1 Hypothetical protein GL50803_36983 [Giardia lamblia ATCC 50803]
MYILIEAALIVCVLFCEDYMIISKIVKKHAIFVSALLTI